MSLEKKMKSLCLMLVMAVLGGPIWAADDDGAAATAESAAQYADSKARLTVVEGDHDFGVIREGDLESVKHTFRIKNTGEEDLKILKVKNSCGCTTSQPSSENLKPGEEATIEAEVKLKGKSGSTVVSVTVDTNDPTNLAHVFRIRGTILSPLRIIPQVLDLQAVGAGEVRRQAVNVSSQYLEGDVVPRIVGLHSEAPEISAATREAASRPVGTGEKAYFEFTQPIEVEVAAGEQLGQREATLVVHTDQIEKPTHTIQVRWRVEGDIQREPDKVYVSRIKNRTIDRPLTLRSRKGEEFHVNSIRALVTNEECDFIDIQPVSGETPDMKKYIVRINQNGTEKPAGTFQGEIVFETDHPEYKVVKVPFVAVFR